MSHLTEHQRYTISCLLQIGRSQTFIASSIGKDKSVVSREIRRNADERNGEYRSDLAQRKYEKRQQEKPKKIRFTEPVCTYVEDKLRQKYSPEQIAGEARRLSIDCVSAERIYQHVWRDKKHKGQLFEHLRTQGKRYRKRGSLKDKRGLIKDRTDINERPEIAESRSRAGDLEIDTIIGKNHKGAIVTVNDRASGKLKMKKLKSKEAAELSQAAIELLSEWKPHLKTITSDNGKEFGEHKKISQALDVDFYFAHPYHSWERGANENLNGLVRQYIPKKTNFETITDEYISFVENELNNRPRKRLNFDTPNHVFNQLINQDLKVAFVT